MQGCTVLDSNTSEYPQIPSMLKLHFVFLVDLTPSQRCIPPAALPQYEECSLLLNSFYLSKPDKNLSSVRRIKRYFPKYIVVSFY